MNLKALEKSGHQVRVITRRYLRNDKKLYTMTAIREFNFGQFVSPRGGEIEVRLTKNGVTARGISICHLDDNFNRKEGVKIATDRALGILEIVPFIQEEKIA